MAHELTIRRDGKVEMAYQGEEPWHQLGTKVPEGATLEEWTHAAGMEWQIEASPVSYTFQGETYNVTDRLMLHRSDSGRPLGVVSGEYHPVQPAETIHFFADLIDSLGLKMATAGTLFGGRKFWATGYIGEDSVVDNRDLVRGYLLISTSSDGSMATTARFTSTRVVCANTLRMAQESQEVVRVLHSSKFDPAAAKKLLGLAPKTFETFMARMRVLAATPVDHDDALELTNRLVKTEDGPVSKRIMEIFDGDLTGGDLEGSNGTAWAWLNSVTQFVDHDRRALTDSHRINSMFLGGGDRMKNRAVGLINELVPA